MATIKKKSSIEIERSPIEKFLMSVKDFLKGNSRKVIITSIFIIAIIAVSLTSYVLINEFSEKDLTEFELIIDNYRNSAMDQTAKEKAISDLKRIISETKFGFVHEMSHYFLADILFSDKKFGEAYEMFEKFIDKSSDDVFVPISINKASICLEEQGKIDEALAILNEYESDNSDSIIMDQILYNSARLYSLKNNQIKSREYYNKVITMYPDSLYAERSRERLLMLSVVK